MSTKSSQVAPTVVRNNVVTILPGVAFSVPQTIIETFCGVLTPVINTQIKIWKKD